MGCVAPGEREKKLQLRRQNSLAHSLDIMRLKLADSSTLSGSGWEKKIVIFRQPEISVCKTVS
jgi:hypothetical protein